MNKCFMIANAVADPRTGTTQSGVAVSQFRIAVKRYQRTEDDPDSDFFNVVCWRKLAEFVGEYVKKGKKVGIVGEIHNRSYTNEDGTKFIVTEIHADNVELLSPKEEEQPSRPPKAKPVTIEPVEDDDFPF